MTNPIAYTMGVHDCDAYFYTEKDDANGAFCTRCGSLIEGYEFSPRNIGKRQFRGDWGTTYDGQYLITDHARKFLSKHKIKFHVVQANLKPKLYALFLDEVFKFDYKATGTRFVDYCEACRQYKSVVGALPCEFTFPPSFDPMKLYRSDLRFGTGREKGYVIAAGAHLKTLLEKEFQELYFEHVIID